MTNRLLVVDDNESGRDMLSRRLRRYGYAVETASNDREALSAIGAGGVELVLLDIEMPGMSGLAGDHGERPPGQRDGRGGTRDGRERLHHEAG
jgi:PleD family two-component response regulator